MTAKAESLSVRLPAAVRDQVDELAHRTRRSRSFIIKEAVSSYVQSQEQYRRELNDAIRSAQSGVGHSREQVFAWMDSWAEGKKLPLPAPDIFPGE